MSPELDALIRAAIMLLFVLTTVLALVWIERKLLGRIQMRIGPMRTGPHGLLQSPADAIKILVKEDLIPASADRWAFKTAPYLIFIPIFLVFVSLPFTRDLAIRSLDLGLFYIMAVSSLTTIGFVMAGWASDNKYALLGAARAVAQLVSYELPLIIAILGVAMFSRSLNLATIVEDQAFIPYAVSQPVGLFLFLVSALAELNRTPFDIPIAESEVVGGPFVEYSGMRWGIFFLTEYANVFAISAICALVFLGGWVWPFPGQAKWLGGFGANLLGAALFLGKTYVVIISIFWLRATLPRLRIDQLMDLAWKILIPLALLNLLLTGAHIVYGWPNLTIVVIELLLLLGAAYMVYAQPRWSR